MTQSRAKKSSGALGSDEDLFSLNVMVSIP
jgi:hypothetical protein